MGHAHTFKRWSRAAAAATVAIALGAGCDASAPPPAREAAPIPEIPLPSGPLVEGIALGIVYDTSGSMRDEVMNSAGAMEAKFHIAARALDTIADRLAAFQSATPRRLDVGVWTFFGASVSRMQSLSSFDATELKQRVALLPPPSAETPLGEGLATAAAAVLASNLTHRHVLVVTDGLNTAGPDPAEVLGGLREALKRRDTTLGVHFVAFDVAARVFDPLKDLGATVLAATDERTLGDQLGFIVERKILLEDEEPATGTK